MTEINNIPNFGYNHETNRSMQNKDIVRVPEAEGTQREMVPDSGVLGRSQIKNAKIGNISQSVDAAVKLAKNNPVMLEACDDIYENAYAQKKKEGASDSEANYYALNVEAEFLDLLAARGV